MDRQDFQRLASLRRREAKKLLDSGLYDGANYLSGYAVECGLKACLARAQFRLHEWPERDVVTKMYTHDLEKLVELAGLRSDLDKEMALERRFEANWATVKDWSPESRYISGRRDRQRISTRPSRAANTEFCDG